MRTPIVIRIRVFLVAAAAVGISLAALSCGGPRRAGSVNPSQARDALHATLESWKSGEAADALQNRSKITVQDLDWMAGYKLLDYELIGSGTSQDTQLRCPVKLSLQSPDGKELSKDVAYVVGTNPIITVFREMQM